MSGPPPKKVGSLRDRIAAFENKGPAPTPASAPLPRPKPAGGVQWKPRPASPSSLPRSSEDNAEKKPGSSMSPSDAKESITKGGSLKERMAALQGRGGFGGFPGVGASPTSPPPMPAAEKPKWKPPPTITSSRPEGEEQASASETHESSTTSPRPSEQDAARHNEDSQEHPTSTEIVPEEEHKPDPEEEERQRRAAIAARMARLGGARVGMAPPVFGKKPEIKKPSLLKEEEAHVEHNPTSSQATPAEEPNEASAHPLKQTETETSKDQAASVPSPVSALEATAPPPARQPTSMPVPTAPRRVAPPRRKVPKEPSPTPPSAHVIGSEITQSPAGTPDLGSDAGSHEFAEAVKKSKEIEADLLKDEHPTNDHVTPAEEDVDLPIRPPPASEHEPTEVTPLPPAPVAAEDVADSHSIEQKEANPIEEVAEVASQPNEDDEDEATRHQRIAERVTKMGGFNPFGGPPPPARKPSLSPSQHDREDDVNPRRDSIEVPQSPPLPPPAARRSSIRKDSIGSPSNVPPPPRRPSMRRGSVDSITSRSDSVRSLPPPLPTSPKPRRESTGSVTSIISVPTRRLSQDDRKPMPIPEGITQHQISEEISEEPESVLETQTLVAQTHEIGHHPPSGRESLEDTEAAARGLQGLGYESPPEEGEEEEEEEEDNTPGTPDVRRGHRVSYLRVEEDQAPTEQQPDEAEETYVPPIDDAPKHEFIPPPPPPSLPHPQKRTSISLPPRVPPPPPLDQLIGVPPPPPPILRAEPETHQPYSSKHTPSFDMRIPPPPPLASRPPPRIPPPPPVSVTPQREELEEELEDGEEADSPALSPLESRDNVSYLDIHDAIDQPQPPPRPVPDSQLESMYNDEGEEGEEGEEDNIEEGITSHSPLEVRRRSIPPPPKPPPVPPQLDPAESEEDQTSEYSGTPVEEEPEHEVLDEEDGDPIDPSFLSPLRSPHTSLTLPSPVVPPPPPPTARVVSPQSPPSPPATGEEDKDEEKTRRRTIAERMAKLGGLSFGAPLPVRRPQPPPLPTEEVTNEEGTEDHKDEPQETLEEEEDEFTRKQRIAARIAGMGGMRFGMFPTTIAPPPPSVVESPKAAEVEGGVVGVFRPPPSRFVPPPPPPPLAPIAKDEEFEQVSGTLSTSDDGVHVEAEDSEMEEVALTESQEAPPPIPTREGRRASTTVGVPQRAPPVPPAFVRPPIPTGRPVVPGPLPSRPSATVPTTTTESPVPAAAVDGIPSPPPSPPPQHTYPPVTPITPIVQNDYVIVEAADATEEPPPPPPPRPGRAALPRTVAPPPPPTELVAPARPSKHQSMPSITNVIDFGQDADLSFSGRFAQGSSTYQAPIFSPPPPPRSDSLRNSTVLPASQSADAPPPPPPVVEQQLSADDLMAHWGRVGVQIHDTANNLFEKSKKSLVGDGTFVGFVVTVLAQVSAVNQPVPPFDSFGYLIYSQSGTSVLRRASDIMPGDVIELHDAKFKGHKGLQTYHQTVGAGERLVAVIADFEVKKSKVKVFQANQHVGQQSVESASYRLEDMKSGSVKVYRVLAA